MAGYGAAGAYGAVGAGQEGPLEVGAFVDRQGWVGYHYCVMGYVASVKVFCGICVSSLPFLLEELQAEFNVNRAEIAAAAGAMLFGAIAGVLCGGMCSDACGRKTALVSGLASGSAISLLHFLVTDYWQFFALRALLGIPFGMIVSVMNVYLVEFLPSSTRGFSVCIVSLGWKVGSICGTCLPWVLTAERWRMILACGPAVAGVIGALVVLCLAPESYRWLFTHHRDQEALAVLQRVYSLPAPPEIAAASAEKTDVSKQCANSVERVQQCFSPVLRFSMCLALLIWCINVGCSYAWGLWGPEIVKMSLKIKRMPYELFIAGEIIGIVSMLAYAAVLDLRGRKPTLIGCFTAVAGVIILLAVVPTHYWVIVVLFLLMSLPWEALWCVKILYTKEAFPTSLRGTATGVCNFAGRLSGTLFPIFVGWLLDIALTWALVAVAGAMLTGAALCALIPVETARKPIKDFV